MINQTRVSTDTVLTHTLLASPDGDVNVSVLNSEGDIISSGTAVAVSPVKYSYDLDKNQLSKIETISIDWEYTISGVDYTDKELLDVLPDDRIRYCYQYDVRRKMYDVMLPDDLDISNYTLRASNELERALQGLYVLPLEPVQTESGYEQDVISLRELCSDIAVGYLIEDTSVSRGDLTVNGKKSAAFAELNRYVKLEKVFNSIPRNEEHTGLEYQSSKPRISANIYIDGSGKRMDDPFNQIYNNFSPVDDHV